VDAEAAWHRKPNLNSARFTGCINFNEHHKPPDHADRTGLMIAMQGALERRVTNGEF
jgi:hypothetical protein